jgi:hypothetical protein
LVFFSSIHLANMNTTAAAVAQHIINIYHQMRRVICFLSLCLNNPIQDLPTQQPYWPLRKG